MIRRAELKSAPRPAAADDNDEVVAHHFLGMNMMPRDHAGLAVEIGNSKPIFRYFAADSQKAVP
jgi:hypothetical protein